MSRLAQHEAVAVVCKVHMFTDSHRCCYRSGVIVAVTRKDKPELNPFVPGAG